MKIQHRKICCFNQIPIFIFYFTKLHSQTIQTKNGFFMNEFLLLPPISKGIFRKTINGAVTDR
jgi:hypothetical protein